MKRAPFVAPSEGKHLPIFSISIRIALDYEPPRFRLQGIKTASRWNFFNGLLYAGDGSVRGTATTMKQAL